MSRLVFAHCASCHREGGSSFSLMTYRQARPWAVAIKDEVLERRMPPWGAVDGFGDFQNDEALTETNWRSSPRGRRVALRRATRRCCRQCPISRRPPRL